MNDVSVNFSMNISLSGDRLIDSFQPTTNDESWMKRVIMRRRDQARYSVVSDAVKRAFKKVKWGGYDQP